MYHNGTTVKPKAGTRMNEKPKDFKASRQCELAIQKNREEAFILGVFVGLGEEFRGKNWSEKRMILKQTLPYLSEEEIVYWLNWYR